MADLNKIDEAVRLHLAYNKAVDEALAADRGVTPELDAACDAWLDALGELTVSEFNVYEYTYQQKKEQA